MSKKGKKECPICGQTFLLKDLFPIALLRHAVFSVAQQKYPNLDHDSFLCMPDLSMIRGLYWEGVLKEEKGALSELENEVLQSLKKQEILAENVNVEFEGQLTFGQQLSDQLAKFGGSWTFITIFFLVLCGWIAVNLFGVFELYFDPYPFILLNLVLSCLAAIQAPVILMSQNRQAAKDRLSQESDYQTNLKAELEIRQLNARLEFFMRQHWQKMTEFSSIQEEILQELELKRR